MAFPETFPITFPVQGFDLEDQVATIANYFPSGRAFGAAKVTGTIINNFLLGLAQELIRVNVKVREFRLQILPDSKTLFLEEWERALAIPDSCFDINTSTENRIRNIETKISQLGVQIASSIDPQVTTFESVALRLGIVVTVSAGFDHAAFPYTLPMIFFTDLQTARFTIVVRQTLPAISSFTYTFPIPFGNDDLILMQCVLTKLKPANCDIKFVTV